MQYFFMVKREAFFVWDVCVAVKASYAGVLMFLI